MAGVARYDEIADFYASGWSDTIDDPASLRLLALLEPVAGRRMLEIACGHGRISRELARRGAEVVGADISAALIGKAEAAERAAPLGVRYLHADVTAEGRLRELGSFDAVVCGFGLSDIDDLDGAVATAAAALRPGGIFACSILHPCFPGGPGVSGSWPAHARYQAEGWWRAVVAAPSGGRQPPDAGDVRQHLPPPRAVAGRAGRARAGPGLGGAPAGGGPASRLPRHEMRQRLSGGACGPAGVTGPAPGRAA
ncbi:class I SAM-dependent methyltransferase [Nonomuraea fuscirosea]|uniref:class I SAM-dependent methyltransferase n=1 Tax=Nonomuraea fuscirosea TaxID=1291556 RepID=UPI0037A1F4E8